MWTMFFLLYQLWHIPWKEGMVDLVKKTKNGDIWFDLKPPTLLDLVKMFFYLPLFVLFVLLFVIPLWIFYPTRVRPSIYLYIGHCLQDGEKIQYLLWLSIQPIDCFNLDFFFFYLFELFGCFRLTRWDDKTFFLFSHLSVMAPELGYLAEMYLLHYLALHQANSIRKIMKNIKKNGPNLTKWPKNGQK